MDISTQPQNLAHTMQHELDTADNQDNLGALEELNRQKEMELQQQHLQPQLQPQLQSQSSTSTIKNYFQLSSVDYKEYVALLVLTILIMSPYILNYVGNYIPLFSGDISEGLYVIVVRSVLLVGLFFIVKKVFL